MMELHPFTLNPDGSDREDFRAYLRANLAYGEVRLCLRVQLPPKAHALPLPSRPSVRIREGILNACVGREREILTVQGPDQAASAAMLRLPAGQASATIRPCRRMIR